MLALEILGKLSNTKDEFDESFQRQVNDLRDDDVISMKSGMTDFADNTMSK